MVAEPSTKGSNGRFAPGNPGGPGNPFAKRMSQIRAKLYETVTDDDLTEVVKTLVSQAKGGDIHSIKELLDRLLGKPLVPVAMDVQGKEVIQINVSDLRQQILANPEFVEFQRLKAIDVIPSNGSGSNGHANG